MKVLLFGAPWCSPCKALYSRLIAATESAGLPFEYVDVELYDRRSVDVTSVPTVRLYDEEETVLMEHRGGMTVPQITSFIERAAGW